MKYEIYDFDETLTKMLISDYILSLKNVKMFRDIVLTSFASHIEKRHNEGIKIIILSYNTKDVIFNSFKLLLPYDIITKISIITPDMFGWSSNQVHMNRINTKLNMKRNFIKFLLDSDSSLKPTDIKFYDDNKDNIIAVKTLGVECIWVKNDKDLLHFI